MKRKSALVVGASGELGQSLLRQLGPQTAIAASRGLHSPLPGFEHVRLENDGSPPAHALARSHSVINAAGKVSGEKRDLYAANVELPVTIARAAANAGVRKMVHVSSFSVAGFAERLGNETIEDPSSPYGRSKASGDQEILSLVRGDFAIECVRLPFMFSAGKPGLLAPLLSLYDRLGMLPVCAGRPFERSMITYRDAARTMVACASDAESGKTYAADPILFTYSLLSHALVQEGQRPLKLFPVAEILANTIERVAPAIGRRLFRSSVLSPEANRLEASQSGLMEELRILIRTRYQR